MLELVNYTELKNNKVLNYIETHWQACNEISSNLQPGKFTTYHLLEFNQTPKHFLLCFKSNYQNGVDQSKLDAISCLKMSEQIYNDLNQKSESLLEKSYASLESPEARQKFRYELFTLPLNAQVESLKSQTKKDLERLQESVLKCIEANHTNDNLRTLQSKINQLIASKSSYYEGTFGAFKY